METDYRAHDPLIEKKTSLDPDLYKEIEEYHENKDASAFRSKLREWKYVYFQPITKGSVRSSILCLLCVTIGSGLLSLPFIISRVGIILGLIIFAISAIATHWTLSLITETSKEEEIYDYSELVEKYFGPKMLVLTEIMSLVNNMGGIVALNKISNFNTYFSHQFYNERPWVLWYK